MLVSLIIYSCQILVTIRLQNRICRCVKTSRFCGCVEDFYTNIIAGPSPAAAIAGSKCILHGRPWSCKNCVGSAFWKEVEKFALFFCNHYHLIKDGNIYILLKSNNIQVNKRLAHNLFVKILSALRPSTIVNNHSPDHPFLFPCFVPHCCRLKLNT